MRFDEFELYAAIYDVREEVASPGSDSWLLKGEELYRLIIAKLPIRMRESDPSFSLPEIVDAWTTFRKSGKSGEGEDRKRIENTIIVGRMFGVRCFWKGRIAGDCTTDIQVDRIIPGSRGGRYVPANCVLSCGFHNSLRGDMDIEEFLQKHGVESQQVKAPAELTVSTNP